MSLYSSDSTSDIIDPELNSTLGQYISDRPAFEMSTWSNICKIDKWLGAYKLKTEEGCRYLALAPQCLRLALLFLTNKQIDIYKNKIVGLQDAISREVEQPANAN